MPVHHLHEHVFEIGLQHFELLHFDAFVAQLRQHAFDLRVALQRQDPAARRPARRRLPAQRRRQAIRVTAAGAGARRTLRTADCGSCPARRCAPA